jgi:hypothetical protein
MQGCKLLSDIGQCPTKFGKCPCKSNFDRTLVRSQRNGYTYLSRNIYLVTYICPTKFSGVGFCPTKFMLCPTKIKSEIKSDRTDVLSSQIFAALNMHDLLIFNAVYKCANVTYTCKIPRREFVCSRINYS